FISLVDQAERDARDLVFVIGGADGLPEEWKKRADLLVGLSPMTMPHELARVVLAEQIYGALTALRGHPYPRYPRAPRERQRTHCQAAPQSRCRGNSDPK